MRPAGLRGCQARPVVEILEILMMIAMLLVALDLRFVMRFVALDLRLAVRFVALDLRLVVLDVFFVMLHG